MKLHPAPHKNTPITVTDHWGGKWDVEEARQTDHGFDILLGRPHGIPRGRGGLQIIIAAEGILTQSELPPQNPSSRLAPQP